MESIEPARAPIFSSVSPAHARPLGRLVQSARREEIGQTGRGIVVVGIVIFALNGFVLLNLSKQVEQAVVANHVAPERLEAFRRSETKFAYAFHGGGALFGAAFIACGLLATRFPVPVATTSLVLTYILMALAALLSPSARRAQALVFIPLLIFLHRAFAVARTYARHAQPATDGEIPQ